MVIDTQKLKELRQRTDAGYMDCKKALEETNNDLEAAIKWLQENGKAKAAKKAGRIAAEGLVATFVNDHKGLILEVNSETDFVSKNLKFKELIEKVGQTLLNHDLDKIKEIGSIKIDNTTIEDYIVNAAATIGERITLRRAAQIVKPKEGHFFIGAYTHHDGQKAALLLIENGNEEMAKFLAMHITAMDPKYLTEEFVPQNIKDELKKEFSEQVNSDPKMAAKPVQIRDNIINGMINKKLGENVFVLQDFVVEPGQNVKQYMSQKNAAPIESIRFEVGEGIEKVTMSFADEVNSQIK